MSVLGHVAIGVAVARGVTRESDEAGLLQGRMVGFGTLGLLPDVDLFLHEMAPRVGLFDHRGPSHSLTLAVLVGLAIAISIISAGGEQPLKWGLLGGAVLASHGIMDAFGQSDLGVELLWPLSDARILAPWHVLPNPTLGDPIGSQLRDLALEAVLFMPLWLYAFVPRRWLREA
jgi:membrane-bound metal-dependent hydrolase YbcI (DUF457 family)